MALRGYPARNPSQVVPSPRGVLVVWLRTETRWSTALLLRASVIETIYRSGRVQLGHTRQLEERAAAHHDKHETGTAMTSAP